MCNFSAAGICFKPFVIYPHERIPSSVSSVFPHGSATMAGTASGWMDSSTFCLFLDTMALEASAKSIKFPLVLFVDNHASHVSLAACQKAESLGITMIFLYPNSTFLLQPADVAVFRSMKSMWRKEIQKGKNIDITINKANFADYFMKAFRQLSPEVIRNGFRRTGLFPFNAENVDFSKCLGKVFSPSTSVSPDVSPDVLPL